MDALKTGIERGVIEEKDVTQEALEGFFGAYGRKFYQVKDEKNERIVLKKSLEKIVDVLKKDGISVEVVPFRKGEQTWSAEWK